MLTAKEARELHDKAYTHNQETRERAAEDLVFYWITQWEDTNLSASTLQVKMEFNQLRKAGSRILTDLKTNPIQVDFEPVGDLDEELSDIVDGMYRARMRSNIALEAKENACMEALVCGFGAWEQVTEEVEASRGQKRQVITRKPIFEANNTAFCDPDAKLSDKSDSNYWSLLVPYTEDGYKALVQDLTGKEIDDVAGSFALPEEDYDFYWVDSNEVYYVSRFYHRTKKKMTVHIFADMLGDEKEVKDTELEDREEELALDGYEKVGEYERETYEVKLYIIGGGDEILAEYDIPGENIPVIPMYGERAYVDATEHYEGITKLAKDPQRLRNFVGSYIADIASRTPIRQAIYFPEQIQGFEYMYEQNGADQVYPYLLQNMKDIDGNPLPQGPIAETAEQKAPAVLRDAIQIAEQAMSDVTGSEMPDNIADLDLSGEALKEVRMRMEAQSYVYQHNLKTALRRDAEVFVGIASEIYDTQETVSVVKFDNTKSRETINEQQIDPVTLQIKVKNNLKDAKFEVYADIGASYSSLREKNRAETKEMILNSPPDDPMRQIMLLQWMTLQEGNINKQLRNHARKQLILQGIYEPETPEEQEMLAQAQQAQANQQDPQMMLMAAEAQARQMEGQAAIQNEINDANKILIDKQKADNDTAKVQIEAAKAGVEIDKKQQEAMGIRIDNRLKLSRPLRQVSQ